MTGIFLQTRYFPNSCNKRLNKKSEKKFQQLSFDLANGHVIPIAPSGRSVYMLHDVIISLRLSHHWRAEARIQVSSSGRDQDKDFWPQDQDQGQGAKAKSNMI